MSACGFVHTCDIPKHFSVEPPCLSTAPHLGM